MRDRTPRWSVSWPIPEADGLLVIADRVLTFDNAPGAAADALLVRDGRFAAIGPASRLRAAAGRAEILEYPGASILPGLTDAHIHLTEWALARREADLSRAADPGQVLDLVRDAASRSHGGWVRGRGWNPHRWGGRYPDRAGLDRALPERPVALMTPRRAPTKR